jgi:Penicillin tolerance protein
MGWLENVNSVGVTAGASAPEFLVQELVSKLKENFNVDLKEVFIATENVRFSLPSALSA